MAVAARTVRAPRGARLSCLAWPQEAAFRMIQNNLDPEVAEKPDELIVYGGTGRAARSWQAFDKILDTLKRLKDDETLLVQSGKPVGVFRTHEGRLVVTAGLGGMGGAQPLAITMNGGVALVVEVDPLRAERRLKQGFLDEITDSLDDALARVEGYLGSRTPRSIALIANAAAILPELVRRDVRVDVVTDQTSAHDPLDGYVPDVKSAAVLRINDPAGYVEASRASIAKQ